MKGTSIMRKIYLTSGELDAVATITKIDAEIAGIYLDQSNFVPQGGGQKSDTGTLGAARVLRADYSNDARDIVHIVTSIDGLHVGAMVELHVDAEPRSLHSRLHTAGHLIAGVVEKILPDSKARGGHHWPGEARVEFNFPDEDLPASFESSLQAHLSDAISADSAVVCTDEMPPPRLVRIEGFAAIPCGGSHVGKLNEIGTIVVRNIRLKKGILRVGYDIGK
jgi:Ser-tRNA(Ala) deacylase AlaX